MASLFKRKTTECSLIGREEGKAKYVCRTPAGKDFVVEVDQTTDQVEIKKAVVMPSPKEYREIMGALKDKGEKIVV